MRLCVSQPFDLHHGDSLPDARMAFRLDGKRKRARCRRARRHLRASDRHRLPGEGWWPEMVGPGLGVDTRQYRVLGIDYIGGRGDSATPERRRAISRPSAPMIRPSALSQIVRHLGIRNRCMPSSAPLTAEWWRCVLRSAIRQLVGHIVVLSAADRSQVLSTAWRSVQRQIVREAIARGDGAAGLKLARALAMATYRSPIEFAIRFGGAPKRMADRFRFPIEEYLFARGDDYVQKYRAESFLTLSESIDLHEMDATLVHTPATLIAVREDQLVPFNDMQALSARLNGPRQLIEINSIFGHDAFLKEGAALTPIIKHALAEQQP